MRVPMKLVQDPNYKFWSKVAPGCGKPEKTSLVSTTTPCWKWTGAVTSQGYGTLTLAGKQWLAHRYSLVIRGRGLGEQTDHLCRNRLCVNPDHLEIVTIAENTRRGLGKAATALNTDHCKSGHLLSGANLGIRVNGYRRCKECGNLAAARYRDRIRKEEKSHGGK